MSGYPNIPDYDILEEVGAGGMGTVYKALHKTLKKVRAVKILSDQAHARRFEAEVRSLAELEDHPNIVSIFEVNLGWTPPYFAMAFLDGPTLRQLMNQDGVPWPRALNILSQIGDALDYAHAHGIVHRDVKPGNIIVVASSTGDRAVLTDFGIAKHHDFDHTRPGSELGSANYVSPEVAAGHAATPKSDIYALGVIAYELLLGTYPPFGGDPPNPATFNSRVSVKQGGILQGALAKDPGARYSSASHFVNELKQAVARKVSTTPPWQKALLACLALVACASAILAAREAGYFAGGTGRGSGTVSPQAESQHEGATAVSPTRGSESETKIPAPPVLDSMEKRIENVAGLVGRARTLINQDKYSEVRSKLKEVVSEADAIRSEHSDRADLWMGLSQLTYGLLAMQQRDYKTSLSYLQNAFASFKLSYKSSHDERIRADALRNLRALSGDIETLATESTGLSQEDAKRLKNEVDLFIAANGSTGGSSQ